MVGTLVSWLVAWLVSTKIIIIPKVQGPGIEARGYQDIIRKEKKTTHKIYMPHCGATITVLNVVTISL